MDTDAELLREFANEGSQPAFTELVARRINSVYATALRQVGRDSHLAQDVAQGVFLALARQAKSVQRHPTLSGWLHTTTRFVAAKIVRTERRWQRREQEANGMSIAISKAEPAWTQLDPVIDEILDELKPSDRDAILLRFFEGKTFAEVGAAIGLAENAARMRVDRALEKLRGGLMRRGISSSAALGAVLAAQPVVALPAGFAASVAGTALAGSSVVAGGAVAGAWWWTGQFMSTTKVLLGTAGGIAVVGIGLYFTTVRGRATTPEDAAQLPTVAGERSTGPRRQQPAQPRPQAMIASTPSHAGIPGAGGTSGAIQRLRVLMDLQRSELAKTEIAPFVNAQFKLTPAFAELFALTTAEREALQKTIDATRERLADLERQNAIVRRAPGGDVLITVNAFPDTGGAAYDAFIASFAETLGPDRHGAFMVLGAEQVEKALGRFGVPQRQLTFSRRMSSEGDMGFSLHEEFQLLKENSRYSSDFKSFAEMSEQIGTVVRLLPSDFTP